MQINSTFSPIDIAISGLQAQNENIKLISSNVANSQSTNNGKPYRRVETVLKADSENGIGGVTVHEISTDMSNFQKVLKPGHPDADKDGYVKMPNVNLPIEIVCKLKWREIQKVVVRKRGKGILIADWVKK